MNQSAMSQSPGPVFTLFPDLPVELRLKIFGHACHQPRNVTVNNQFVHQEVGNTIFFTQRYYSALTNLSVPEILFVSKEARAEALKHYELAFEKTTSMNIDGKELVYAYPGFWVNWECDRIVPRGFYNIVGLQDFLGKVLNKSRKLAIDITGDFLKDLYEQYLTKNTYPFGVVKEIMLYDGSQFSPFKDKYSGPKIELEFGEMLDASEKLQVCQLQLSACLGAMVTKMNERTETAQADRTVRPPASVRYFATPAIQIMQPLESMRMS